MSKSPRRKIKTTTKPRRILVPVDFSTASREAAAVAVRLAARFGARLALLHVTPPKGQAGGYGAFELAGMSTDPRRPAREKLAEFTNEIVPNEIEVSRFVESGSAYKQIAASAAHWKADLVVIARSSGSRLTHAILGSTAERVVRHAPCPVLVVRGRPKDPFPPDSIRSILLPTDFSKNSLMAFPLAAGWAREFKAKLILLYVVPEHFPSELSQVGIMFHQKRVAQDVGEQLPEFARTHLGPDVPIETRVIVGAVAATISEMARRLEAGLIVLSSQGHTGLKHLFLGSTAERVVWQARTPVLVVR